MSFSIAQTTSDWVFGDARPDAPELAARGPFAVGVKTFELLNPDQLDILSLSASNPNPRYDRPLTVELFYPALLEGQEAHIIYQDVLGEPGNPNRPNIPFSFPGRALRDAKADRSSGPYPLVIVSHGYLGSRLMMTYLTENLASKGYVVAAIAHTDSTYDDAKAFSSTLLNRALDQVFVLNELDKQSEMPDGFLQGLLDAKRTAIIGYSMGGYGALNAGGAGYSAQIVATPLVPGGALAVRQAGQFEVDPRIKAIIAFAPWGAPEALKRAGIPGNLAFWDEAGLAGLHLPTLFVVGDQDDISGYENGVKWLFDNAINAERYLLVYENARHNVAPNPPPAAASSFPEFERYAEFAWAESRINNINQHFVTAFLGTYLKGEAYQDYLDLPVQGTWKGFKPRTAVGLELYKAE